MDGGAKSCCTKPNIPSTAAAVSVGKTPCHCPAMTSLPKQYDDKSLPISNNPFHNYNLSLNTLAPLAILVSRFEQSLTRSITLFSPPASDRIVFLQTFLI